MFTTLMPHLADRATAETCLVLDALFSTLQTARRTMSPHPGGAGGALNPDTRHTVHMPCYTQHTSRQ